MQTKTQESPHLRDYVSVILKRKWIIATVFVVLVTTVTIGSYKMTPVYQATSSLLIEKEAPNIVNIQEVLAVDASNTDYYKTQYEILKSKSLVLRVIETLNLGDSREFKTKSKKPIIDIKGLFSSWFSKGLDVVSSQKTMETRISRSYRENSLVQAYLTRLSIQPIRDSRLVNISFEGYNPELITGIINTHAQLYIESSLDGKLKASKDALKWINIQIESTKINLGKAEELLQEYREENDLVSINFEEKNNIIIQKLNDLNTALTKAKTKRIGMENMNTEVKRLSQDPKMVESLPPVVSNRLIQELKTQYVKLMGTFSELSQKFGPEHPKMISLRSELSEMKDKIAQEVKNIAQSIELEYQISIKEEQAIAKALEEQKETAQRLNGKEINYNVLKREVETNRVLYESLLTRAKETGITENLMTSNIIVIDQARIPERPVKPNPFLNILLAMITGLTLGVGLAFFFEYLDNTIKTPEEIEKYLNLPTLGIIPHHNMK